MLDYQSAESRKYENEANNFASYLLMPANDFREQVRSQPINLELFRHCSTRYGTSFTATVLKWLELTEELAMLVVARDGFVCWSYPSKRARYRRCFLPPGTELPQDVLERAYRSFNDQFNKDGLRVHPGTWHPYLEAVEFIINSDKYDLIIFFIHFPFAALNSFKEYENFKDSSDYLSDKANGLNWKK
ncbi:protein of unknown function [Nitrosomonas sp. Nm51]|uniref:ImmA/IrrE family metallo-endopeptidase n=1 Tax=Nitrosomonas sp. Nm51 TaxID=133720 RepID=UPI0008D4599F|nr:ImmA/IrrE family metallo-endopeptidase [Nitrosomonas sp. Nm51]SER81109.1 protein of unknown function [Nitrosomonas sp. Nm51]